MELDTIIIGSGAGGLAAAICLSRAGQKVLVLEQHDVPGGWCHSFTLNGSRFTPGVHYIGLMDEGGSSNLLYKGLGVANELVFFRMKEEAYEHCWIGDERFDMPSDFDSLVDSLGERFPDEKKSPDEVFENGSHCKSTATVNSKNEWLLGCAHHSLAYSLCG